MELRPDLHTKSIYNKFLKIWCKEGHLITGSNRCPAGSCKICKHMKTALAKNKASLLVGRADCVRKEFTGLRPDLYIKHKKWNFRNFKLLWCKEGHYLAGHNRDTRGHCKICISSEQKEKRRRKPKPERWHHETDRVSERKTEYVEELVPQILRPDLYVEDPGMSFNKFKRIWCKEGHYLAGDNRNKKGYCRICYNIYQRKRKVNKTSSKYFSTLYCSEGHKRSAETISIKGECLICKQILDHNKRKFLNKGPLYSPLYCHNGHRLSKDTLSKSEKCKICARERYHRRPPEVKARIQEMVRIAQKKDRDMLKPWYISSLLGIPQEEITEELEAVTKLSVKLKRIERSLNESQRHQ